MRRNMQGGDILLVAFLAFSVLNTWAAVWICNRRREKSKPLALMDRDMLEVYSQLRLAKVQQELLGLTAKLLE
jgi:hypothetical protein